jgi:uncharacterized coiled-coil protein SlyX
LSKFLKILAASIGGGIVLGAGIRLGEAIAAQNQPSSPHAGGRMAENLEEKFEQKLNEKIEAIEDRLRNLDVESPAELRGALRDWLDEGIDKRMAEVETRLRAESERGQKQTLDAFAESVQTRVIQRISRLEGEVAGQSAAMNELRDCTLRTERSMQKLLGGLERLVVKNPPGAEEG